MTKIAAREQKSQLPPSAVPAAAAAAATAFCCLIVAFRSPSRERVLHIPPPRRHSPSLRGHSPSHKGAARVYKSAAQVLTVTKLVSIIFSVSRVIGHAPAGNERFRTIFITCRNSLKTRY